MKEYKTLLDFFFEKMIKI